MNYCHVTHQIDDYYHVIDREEREEAALEAARTAARDCVADAFRRARARHGYGPANHAAVMKGTEQARMAYFWEKLTGHYE